MNKFFLLLPLVVSTASQGASSGSTLTEEMTPVPGHAHLLALGLPSVPADLIERTRRYENVRSASLLDVSRDGKEILIATRFGSVGQLHRVSHPMGARTQLTFGDEPIIRARYLPTNSKLIFYFQDTGGAEFFQLYRFESETSRTQLLTDGKSRHESLVVSPDGQFLAFSGTERNGKDHDVYLAKTSNPRSFTRLTELEGAWQPLDFSADGRQLLVRHQRSSSDADLFSIQIETGEKRQLTPKEGKASVQDARYTADGHGVYLITDRYSDHNQLYRLDLAKPKERPRALAAHVPHDVDQFAASADGAFLAFSANEEGYSRLYLVDLKGNRTSPVDHPRGVIGNLVFPRGVSHQLMVQMETPRAPADVWELSVKTRKLTRWTHSEAGGLDGSEFLDPAIVRFPSRDNVLVPALLYRPVVKAREKHPVVVIWHGGPEGQSRPIFNATAQFIASKLNAFVLLPNVRGSSGYGKKYLAMDDGVKREASLADIGATLDWIGKQPTMDANRVGVYGGSYGGYMVLATVAFFPSRVRAGVDIVGISSLPSVLQNTQAYRRDLRRAEYGDERVPEIRAVQERISPLNRAGDIQAALLVVHGKNDPRVPRSEAEQIVSTLRSHGKDVWYLLADNEGHGFKKNENRHFLAAAALLFLEQKLVQNSRQAGL